MHTSITKHSLNNDKTLHLNHFRSQLKHPYHKKPVLTDHQKQTKW